MKSLRLRILLLALCVTAAASAQEQAPFKSGVALVTVDVTVLDKEGKPVPGLTAGDFEIKLGGKVQPVRAVAFVQASNATFAPAVNAPTANAPAVDAAPPTPKPAAAITAKEVEIRRTVSNQEEGAPAAPTAAVAPNAPAHPAPAAPAAPAPPAHQNEPRTFVVLIDDLSFTAQSGKKLFAAAQRFVDRVPSSDPVGFTTTSGSATVNPTMDRAAVKAGLAKVVGEFMDPREIRKGEEKGGKAGMIGMDEAIDIDRGDDSLLMDVIIRECFHGDRTAVRSMSVQEVIANPPVGNAGLNCPSDVASEAKRTAALMRQTKARQLAALTGVINAMRSASGIRHLIFVTDGMAISRDVSDLQPITRVAAAAGLQFSVVMEDPEGTSITGQYHPTPETNKNSNPIRDDNKLMLDGAQTFTDVVGGIFYKVIGDAGPSFDSILNASSAVYRLGVELPAGTQPGKELSLGVSVKQPGLTVRANKMAVNLPDVTPANPAPEHPSTGAPPNLITGPVAASLDDVLKEALNEDRVLRGVPIRLGAMIRRSTNAEGQIDLSVNVIFPPSVKTPITALVGIVDETNALKISRRVVDSTARPVQFLFPLPAGSYAVRFGAAAADGALGTVELPIAVKLHAMGAWSASDVLMFSAGETSQKAALFSMDEVPPAAEPSKYFGSIELYPAGAMPSEPPVVNWTIVRDGDTKPVVDEDVEGRVGTNLFRSDFEIPFESLPPGTYVVRATLIVADKPAGSVGAVIRKK